MSIASKLPTAFDVSDVTVKPKVTANVPARTERFTHAMVKEPTQLAQALTRLQTATNEASLAARSNSRSNAQTFKNIHAGNAGATFTITHNLNRAVQWTVVRWRQGSAGASIVEDDANTTANAVVFISYVTGIVDLEIF